MSDNIKYEVNHFYANKGWYRRAKLEVISAGSNEAAVSGFYKFADRKITAGNWKDKVRGIYEAPVSDFEKHADDFSKLARDENMFYIDAWAVSGLERWGYNGNGDGFPKDELKKAFGSFVERGIYVDHNNKEKTGAIGIICDSVWEEDKERVRTLFAVSRSDFPDYVKHISNGDYTDVSMGVFAKESECSHCHNVATHPSDICECVRLYKAKEIDGSVVGEINRGLNFIELSVITAVGADNNAKSLKEIAANASSKASKKEIIMANENVNVIKASLEKKAVELSEVKEKIDSKIDDLQKVKEIIDREFPEDAGPVVEDINKDQMDEQKSDVPKSVEEVKKEMDEVEKVKSFKSEDKPEASTEAPAAAASLKKDAKGTRSNTVSGAETKTPSGAEASLDSLQEGAGAEYPVKEPSVPGLGTAKTDSAPAVAVKKTVAKSTQVVGETENVAIGKDDGDKGQDELKKPNTEYSGADDVSDKREVSEVANNVVGSESDLDKLQEAGGSEYPISGLAEPGGLKAGMFTKEALNKFGSKIVAALKTAGKTVDEAVVENYLLTVAEKVGDKYKVTSVDVDMFLADQVGAVVAPVKEAAVDVNQLTKVYKPGDTFTPQDEKATQTTNKLTPEQMKALKTSLVGKGVKLQSDLGSVPAWVPVTNADLWKKATASVNGDSTKVVDAYKALCAEEAVEVTVNEVIQNEELVLKEVGGKLGKMGGLVKRMAKIIDAQKAMIADYKQKELVDERRFYLVNPVVDKMEEKGIAPFDRELTEAQRRNYKNALIRKLEQESPEKLEGMSVALDGVKAASSYKAAEVKQRDDRASQNIPVMHDPDSLVGMADRELDLLVGQIDKHL